MKALTAAYVLLLALVAGGSAWTWYAGKTGRFPDSAVIALPSGPASGAGVAAPNQAKKNDGADTTRGRAPGAAASGEQRPDAEEETTQATHAEAGPSPRGQPTESAAPLAPPDPALIEQGRDGPLPRIGEDGRRPWKVYARPFDGGIHRGPLVALVVTDLGLDRTSTMCAIEKSPPAVTLAFSPYGSNLDELARGARESGHETLVAVPMEAAEPTMDPGPQALTTWNSAAENEVRLRWVLSRARGYVGVITDMGSRFTADAGSLRPVMREVRDRGLLFVDADNADPGSGRNSVAPMLAGNLDAPIGTADLIVDGEVSRAGIATHLKELAALARARGTAIGIGHAHCLTIDVFAAWVGELRDRGVTLAPVSAVVRRRLKGQ